MHTRCKAPIWFGDHLVHGDYLVHIGDILVHIGDYLAAPLRCEETIRRQKQRNLNFIEPVDRLAAVRLMQRSVERLDR